MNPIHQFWRIAYGRQIHVADPAPALRHGLLGEPHHAGVILRASGTHLVLEFLAKFPRRNFTTKEVILATVLPLGAVAWALFRLSRQGWIVAASGAGRNQRHLQFFNPGDTRVSRARRHDDAAQQRAKRSARETKEMAPVGSAADEAGT